MRRIFITLVLLLAADISIGQVAKVTRVERHQAPDFVGYVPNEIVIKFSKETAAQLDEKKFSMGATGIAQVDQLGRRFNAVRIRQQFLGAKPKIIRGREYDLSRNFKIKFHDKLDISTVVNAYRKLAGVEYVQPISIHSVQGIPNDTKFSKQWHLNRADDHDIDAPEAWDVETGDDHVIVAILDTGVRYFHKDLGGANASYDDPTNVAGNMWINWAEKNGVDGVDDDGNGYVDDWIGWDFVDGIEDPWPGEDGMDQDNDPRDFNGHGTHCAGNVGAINNNGYATASTSGGWGNGGLQADADGVKVMALRIGYSDALFIFEMGYVRMDFAAEAFRYAADNGAKIASCSWGSSNDGGLGDAIDYFLANGGLIFKAAGNDGRDDADYMGNRTDIINVAATDSNDVAADFTNFGSWVDISAPGTGIWSLYHDHNDPENDYTTYMDGTSMATPIAASVAALIWSKFSGWTAEQVKQRLFDTADDIYSIPGNSSYNGKLGAGRVNAYNAVYDGGTNYNISGTVSYYSESRPVSDATVDLTHPQGSSRDTTDSNGDYLFENIESGSIEIVPGKEDDLRDAITGSDALLVLQYLAFLATMTDDQQFAADVTEDGSVTGSDAQAILRYLAFYTDNIASTGQWRFDPADTSFTLTADAVANFTAFLLGDATGDWGSSSSSMAKNKTTDIAIKIGRVDAYSEQPLQIPVRIENVSEPLHTLLFTISYDASKLRYRNTEKTSLSEHFLLAANGEEAGRVHVAMAGVKGAAEAGEMLHLIFEVIDPGHSTGTSKIEITRARINDMKVVFTTTGVVNFGDKSGMPERYDLSQNYPNPFNPETMVSYRIPSAGHVDLRIYNLAGNEVVRLIDGEKEAGVYRVKWDGKNALGEQVSSGVYIIKLLSGGFSKTRKMLRIN